MLALNAAQATSPAWSREDRIRNISGAVVVGFPSFSFSCPECDAFPWAGVTVAFEGQCLERDVSAMLVETALEG